MSDAGTAAPGLFAKIASSAAYGIVGGLLGRAVGLVGTLLVARHLTPDIVAEVTVATVVALTGNWVAAWGCGQYVVVKGDQGREAIFAASIVYLTAGLVMIAGLLVAAPALASWLQAPRVAEYLPGALLGIGIRRIGAIPDKLLAREMRFGRIAAGTALGDIVYAIVAVTLVSNTTLGGQSMILAFIAQSTVIAGVTLSATGLRSWLAPVKIPLARLRDLLRFGAPITGEVVLSEGARYWDKPLMLRLVGAHDAGSYGLAFNLAQLPAVYVGGHIGTVMMPAVVRADPVERPGLMVRALTFTALVLFPMSAGLAVCAPTLVEALLPPTWSQVAPLLSVLAIASLPGPGSFILSAFLSAHGRNHRLMWIEVATMASLVAALPGFGQSDRRVAAMRQALLLAPEAVLLPPQLRAGGRHLEVQAEPVEQALHLVGGLGLADGDVGQGHLGGILPGDGCRCPRICPHPPPECNSRGEPGLDREKAGTLAAIGFPAFAEPS